MSKIQIDITTVNQYENYLRFVNSIPLEDIELVDRGQPVIAREGAVEDFKFIGLNNTDYIRRGYYLDYTELTPEDNCPINSENKPGCGDCLCECEFLIGTTEFVPPRDGISIKVKCSYGKQTKIKEDE